MIVLFILFANIAPSFVSAMFLDVKGYYPIDSVSSAAFVYFFWRAYIPYLIVKYVVRK